MYLLKLWPSLIVLSCSLFIVQGLQCVTRSDLSGTIVYSVSNFDFENRCWIIVFEEDMFVRISFKYLNLKPDCSRVWLKATVAGTGEEFRFCDGDVNKSVAALNNVTLEFQGTGSVFHLKYHIENILCTTEGSFRCSEHICISKSKVCDGVQDCENGTDEVDCETDITAMEGVEESRQYGISWLKNQRTSSMGWKKNTPRGIIALYLAGDTNFTATNIEENMMAKQLLLEISVAIMRNMTSPLSSNQLSMYINAMLATCHNPRKFYGFDLVQLLKEQVLVSPASSQPASYLTLCNANETLSDSMGQKLRNVLSNDSNVYPFYLDVQAMALMALTCRWNANRGRNATQEAVDFKHINTAVQRFKELQLDDGSFGNVYTTALVTQALLAAGQINRKDWELGQAVNHLLRQLNSSSVDFLSVYLTLPVLNGKSLPDVGKVNCSGTEGKGDDGDTISDIENKLGSKMQVQYSLYVGDQKDVIHTMYLKISENSTALEVMEFASSIDPKYRYRSRMMAGKIYVYEIAGITNDPEAGHFWLLYHNSRDETLDHSNDSPDKFILQDGEHLIMWYRAVYI